VCDVDESVHVADERCGRERAGHRHPRLRRRWLDIADGTACGDAEAVGRIPAEDLADVRPEPGHEDVVNAEPKVIGFRHEASVVAAFLRVQPVTESGVEDWSQVVALIVK
jgi:hypothetical protein